MCTLFARCYGVHDLGKKKKNSLRLAAISIEMVDFKEDMV